MLKQLCCFLEESSLKRAEKSDIRDNRIVCHRCHVLIITCFYVWPFLPGVILLFSTFGLHCELGQTLSFYRFFPGKPVKGLGVCVRQATGLQGIALMIYPFLSVCISPGNSCVDPAMGGM